MLYRLVWGAGQPRKREQSRREEPPPHPQLLTGGEHMTKEEESEEMVPPSVVMTTVARKPAANSIMSCNHRIPDPWSQRIGSSVTTNGGSLGDMGIMSGHKHIVSNRLFTSV